MEDIEIDRVKDNIRRADFVMLKEYTCQLVDEIHRLQEQDHHQMDVMKRFALLLEEKGIIKPPSPEPDDWRSR